jgi:Uma2 family endonuclease
MSVEVERWLFTVDDYYRMAETGILSEDARVELIDGEVVKMSPIGSRHIFCVNRVTKLFHDGVGESAIVSVQNPVRLNDYSEPQPDLALLKPPDDKYRHTLPQPDDVLLVIEVADTSVDFDRSVKIPLYGQAGIAEAWLIALPNDAVEIYSNPVSGVYHDFKTAGRGEVISPRNIPGLTIKVEDVIG